MSESVEKLTYPVAQKSEAESFIMSARTGGLPYLVPDLKIGTMLLILITTAKHSVVATFAITSPLLVAIQKYRNAKFCLHD